MDATRATVGAVMLKFWKLSVLRAR